MKAATFFILSLLIQIGSSTFTEGIDRVMANVETNFNRVLTDVMTDMKEVFDCTVLAMEHILSLDLYGSASEYQRRCLDGMSDDGGEVKETEQQYGSNLSNEVASGIEQVEDQLSSVITNINNTFRDIIDPKDLRAKLDRIKFVLKNETDHLASVSSLFRDKLDKLSDKIKQHPDQNDDLFSEIFTHLEMLHEAEKTENNVDEIREIRDVIKEILKILQFDGNNFKAADDEDKIQAIIDMLSQHAKANETVHQADDGCDNSTELSNNKEISTNVEATNTITTETTNSVTSNEITKTTRSTKKESTTKKSNSDDPFDLSSLLGLDVITVTDKIPDDVVEIMKSQKESESVMNKYFNDPKHLVGDAFSHFDVNEMTDEELESFKFENMFND